MPVWIPLSLLFPTLSASLNVLDKYFVDRYTMYHYSFWIGAFELMIGATVTVVLNTSNLEIRTLLGGVLTGAVSASSILLYLSAIRLGQVARVVPIWYLAPLLVVPMAAGFLGEDVTPLGVAAILMAVGGAVLVSWQRSGESRGFGNPVVPLLALGAAVLLAVTFILTKHFLTDGDFWRFFGAFRLGFAPALLAIGLSTDVRWEVLRSIRDRRFLRLFLFREPVVTASFLARFAAVSTGPVSFVAAIASIQPMLVFLYSLGLATASPARFESWVTRGTLLTQVTGIFAITAGVVIISLQ